MTKTIFERAGGFAQVRKIVSDFYDRVLDEDELAPYFAGIALPRLIDHQTKFISHVMGGPGSAPDEMLRRAHAPLQITHGHFARVAGLLRDVLEDHGLEPADVDFVEREVLKRESLIVSRRS